MKCDICGRESDELYDVIYKGRRGYACPECIEKYGLIKIRKANEPFTSRRETIREDRKRSIAPPAKPSPLKRRRTFSVDNLPEFVENYGKLIKRGREKLGLTQEDLARELKVKLSYIKKIESEALPPSMDIARRLETLLNIRLFKEEKEEEYETPRYREEDFSVTLGDLIRFEDED